MILPRLTSTVTLSMLATRKPLKHSMPIADMAQAAKVLAQHIKDYKINTAGQLDKETGLLVNFITDLEDKYSAQVAKLGLTEFVTNLKEANERVRMLTLQRTNEKMGVTVGALKAARTASDDAYRALVKMVNALALVYGEKDYTAFIGLCKYRDYPLQA